MGSDHEQEVVCSNPNNSNYNSSIFRILFDEKQSYVTEAQALLRNYLIDSKELEIGAFTGVGSSGIVYKALYKGQNVAVKVLKGTLSRGGCAAKAGDEILRSARRETNVGNGNGNGASGGGVDETFWLSAKSESTGYFDSDSETFWRSAECKSNDGNGEMFRQSAKCKCNANGYGNGEMFRRSAKGESNGNSNRYGDGETFWQSESNGNSNRYGDGETFWQSENNGNGNVNGRETVMRRSRSEGDQLGRNKTEGEFRREVLSLISCAHKNILKLYGVCISPHLSICIVTKFMQGGSLLHYLQQRKSLRICEILKLAKDVAQGMEFLHSRGIVHMDLKTANVFLGEEGNAVIGDLGVARLANEVEDGGREIGTYRWMAPEVCGAESGRGGGFSYKSDVYSYGILVWELVTCKMPFADYSPVQAAVGVVMHALRPPIPPACFPPLRYLIQKCWDQDPCVRPHFSQILKMLHIISQQNWS